MKTPGQIAFNAGEALYHDIRAKEGTCDRWESISELKKKAWESAAQAVLSSQWRRVDDPPDDNTKLALFMCHGMFPRTLPFREGVSAYSHWMPIPAIPAPTEEEKSRAEFEKHMKSRANIDSDNWTGIYKGHLWEIWQAARKSKEGEKP